MIKRSKIVYVIFQLMKSNLIKIFIQLINLYQNNSFHPLNKNQSREFYTHHFIYINYLIGEAYLQLLRSNKKQILLEIRII